MASYTTNYSFKKPSTEDAFDIDDFNDNFDLVDQQLSDVKDQTFAKMNQVSADANRQVANLKSVVEDNRKSLQSSINTLSSNTTNAINSAKIDFIVSQGTSGSWTWRRWNSGIQECWARIATSSFTTNISWGSIYRTGTGLYNQKYPLAFTSTPNLFRSFDSTKGTSWALSDGGTAASATYTGGTMFANPAQGAVESGYLSYYAIGRWK